MADIFLEDSYIRIKRNSGPATYGGDQGFYVAIQENDGEAKRKMGCGIIALCDYFLYIAKQNLQNTVDETRELVHKYHDMQDIPQNEYMEYFDRMYKLAGGVSLKRGMTGIKLGMAFQKIFDREGMPYKARWGVRTTHLYEEIEKSLREDRPVVLSISTVFRGKDRFGFLERYETEGEIKYRKGQSCKAHYILVTGAYVWEGRKMLQISSWGKRYHMDYEEYLAFRKRHFLGRISGNILVISKKEKA